MKTPPLVRDPEAPDPPERGRDGRRLAPVAAMAALMAGWAAGPGPQAAEVEIERFAFGCEAPDGRLLKPRYGDIDGVVFADLPAEREQCLRTIGRRIVLCRENTGFSNAARSEDSARCEPLFRKQAEACVRHFTLERNKCEAGNAESAEAVRLDAAGWRKVQEALLAAGFNPGPVDGMFGPRTRGAVRAWQQANGYPATGEPTQAQARALSGGPAPLEPFGPNWIVASNRPCQVYNPRPKAGELVTWSGDCVDGRASGRGRLVWRGSYGEHVYEGEYRDGRRNGYGTYVWANGVRYEGEFREGMEHGRGTWTSPEGDRFEGELRGGVQHGSGTYAWANGDRYEGEWRDGRQHGHGTWSGANGDRYEGEWRAAARHGYGTYLWDNGDRYEGEFRDGFEHGRGVWTGTDGDRYEGQWRDGKRHPE